MIAVNEDVLFHAKAALTERFGEVDVESDVFPFDFTDYYCMEMGHSLVRKFVSFAELIDPGILSDIKTRTNELERAFADNPDCSARVPSGESDGKSQRRRVNLDPGYLSLDKLVLATTKNFAHRIYLGRGIYGEVTLNFREGGCVYFDWTYPDFKSSKYTHFLLEARRLLKAQTAARQSRRVAHE